MRRLLLIAGVGLLSAVCGCSNCWTGVCDCEPNGCGTLPAGCPGCGAHGAPHGASLLGDYGPPTGVPTARPGPAPDMPKTDK